jgi:hypothetical protein
MSGNTNNGPMLKAASLWSKTSVKGGWYPGSRITAGSGSVVR